MILKKMFSRGWLFTTLLVLAGTAVCARLGIWQLDRHDQRRTCNTQVETMRAADMLDLNQELPSDIDSMEWRSVAVTGEYDFENQVVIRNQYNGNQYGYHIITPLLFDRGAVLVDRGWIPADGNSAPSDWRKYDEVGPQNVTGQIRIGQAQPIIGGVADPELSSDQTRMDAWNNLNLERIAQQIPYPILTVYVQPNTEDAASAPPIAFQPIVELTEGSHFGYALQWFTFATILFVGYPFYLRKQK